jgi:hypothetical protein
MAVPKALSEENSARSMATQASAKGKAPRQAAEQALKESDEAKAKLVKVLETMKATYTVTQDKVASTSKTPVDIVIWEQRADTLRIQAEEKLADAEKKLAAAEEEKKNKALLLKMARHVLYKREDSSTVMILTAVANAMALLKSHLPDLDVELLCKDFTVDEAECEALTNGAYNATHEFMLSYDFSSLAESKDNHSPRNL